MNIQILVLGTMFFASMIVGGIYVGYQLYKIVFLDSHSRGLSHPKLWGIFAISSNNTSGLISYLIFRRKHPVKNISKEVKQEIEERKRRAGIAIMFLAIGGIVLVMTILFI